MENTGSIGIGAAKVFATTRWSVLVACLHDDQVKANGALSELCQAYWRPIYACIRHHGHSVHDAQDLTQEFFVHLLKGKWLHQLDAAKGRFRSYLSTALRHFLISHHRRRWTFWRGWGSQVVSFDAEAAEGRYLQDLATQASPEAFYERQWATTVIDHALEDLRLEMRTKGKEILFGYFDAVLGAHPREFVYLEAARSLGTTVEALHAALARWRGRFRELLREEIGATVTSKSEIDAELEHLQRLSGRPV
ncbi:MAG: sigma-70 family RNA polymerase sigma factor [Rhodospirillales bacterium]|nr:sigma-70 family RNA polymerase sigma factor [Acetobacter sp.]